MLGKFKKTAKKVKAFSAITFSDPALVSSVRAINLTRPVIRKKLASNPRR